MNKYFIQVKLKHAEVFYCEDFFDDDISKYLYEKLNEEIKWEVFKVKVAGNIFNQPRKSCYIADENKVYTYSGFDRIPERWTETLTVLRKNVQQILNSFEENKELKINAVLCNKYENGNDNIGFHSDDERDLISSYIISFSFGSERDFILKSKRDDEKISIPLKSGSVVVMGKNCQKNYLHSIPKRLRVKEPRINLTFRCVRNR